ncbi:MAG: hypothetical protein RHS_3636 [Robinsoniella sp. RHS]|uniref:C39 family peptidase n=1 Tax=Robinsoniella sp. RHS TaxID=1504536 RepID=UPI000659A75E|nr:MAG: hypothetical protein RHS_3636 [Robinsoniella sp. RHS]
MKKKWAACAVILVVMAVSFPISAKSLGENKQDSTDQILNGLKDKAKDNLDWLDLNQWMKQNSEDNELQTESLTETQTETQTEAQTETQTKTQIQTENQIQTKKQTDEKPSEENEVQKIKASDIPPLDLNRHLIKNEVTEDYYVDIKGRRAKNMWVLQGDEEVFLGADGNAIKELSEGWYEIDKKWYYYTDEGILKTGWFTVDGKKYYVNKTTQQRLSGWYVIDDKTYYFDPETGVMAMNQWVGEKYVGPEGTVTKKLPSSASITMKNILQKPELPTGCESVALAMVLKFYDFPVKKTTIADQYLDYSSDNFVSSFVGNPRSGNGAGCYAPAITKAANKYLEEKESELRAEDISGTPLEELYPYIESGQPVLVWNTMYMQQPEFTGATYTENGKTYRWYRKEHCVVLCGYDKEKGTVTVNDPLEGIIERNAEDFEAIYDLTGQMAVLIQ